eukprot:SAG31_NODE_2546_length_5531_cov_1.748159_6_plen_134_part_00
MSKPASLSLICTVCAYCRSAFVQSGFWPSILDAVDRCRAAHDGSMREYCLAKAAGSLVEVWSVSGQVRAVTFSFLCQLSEKYDTFIARCNALIEKVSPCIQTWIAAEIVDDSQSAAAGPWATVVYGAIVGAES